ncbi:MAG: DegT/DnrJ/EryC1/StrS family aminotransferase [Candidatus Omnitrophota bacterium]
MKKNAIKRVLVLDLARQFKEIKKDILPAIGHTLSRGDFILGKDLALFEREFARYCGVKFCIGVNSGTDALFLGLKSLGIGAGDEVIVPVFTYIASALAVTYTGARPVFVDVDEQTYNIDVSKIEQAITKNTKAIIPVHLYGQPADMKPLSGIAKKHNLKIIEDTAQAHGSKYRISAGKWRLAGGIGDIGCFSFYPTKNLGACGDGGAIITDNEGIYKKLLMLRDYGRKSRYEHVSLGYNSRLDTLQASILRIKLRHLDKWNAQRRKKAGIYNKELKGCTGIILPKEDDYTKHVYHQYVVRVKNRDEVMAGLNNEGIGVLIHYPIPLHLQEVYRNLGYKKGDFPVAERVAREIMSLPMYPNLEDKQVRFVSKSLRNIVDK